MHFVTGVSTIKSPATFVELSWILPVYKTGQFLHELIPRIGAVSDTLGLNHEIIVIIDGCPEYATMTNKFETDAQNIHVIQLSENLGQDAAIMEGLQHSVGNWALMLDTDLQDPPEEAIKLLAKRTLSSDVVFANRQGQYQERSRMLTSRLYRSIFSALSGLPKGACLFALVSRSMITAVTNTRSPGLSLLVLFARHGRHFSSVPIERERRKSGSSAYSMSQRIQRGLGSVYQLLRIKYLDRDMKI